jgi:hypothetical protein
VSVERLHKERRQVSEERLCEEASKCREAM